MLRLFGFNVRFKKKISCLESIMMNFFINQIFNFAHFVDSIKGVLSYGLPYLNYMIYLENFIFFILQIRILLRKAIKKIYYIK